MNDFDIKRSPELVHEEIRDLRKLLSGIPEELIQSGAFIAYEDRLHNLYSELADCIVDASSATSTYTLSDFIKFIDALSIDDLLGLLEALEAKNAESDRQTAAAQRTSPVLRSLTKLIHFYADRSA